MGLGLRGAIWLPLRRTLLLSLPTLLAWPASVWEAGLWPRLAALAAFLVAYPGAALGLGLLPAGEVREIRRSIGLS